MLAAASLFVLPLYAAEISGRVLDASGESVPGATVTLRLLSTGYETLAETNADGTFSFPSAGRGAYLLRVESGGFTRFERSVAAGAEAVRVDDIELQPATIAQEVVVYVNETAALRSEIPGSVDVLDSAILTQSRLFNIDEALRKVPGVYTRGEEGFGLRPNIGIRGLNPTRSTKVLLLEDGIPISYAPYGDNASYYHPPVERFESIEVVKGSGQIQYGPSTVGGVINYITPPPPDRGSGAVTIMGGNRDYFNGHLRYGTTAGVTGLLFDYMRKQGEGSRENTRFGANDATFKLLNALSPRQTLSLKANYYGEDSNLTYSGLRLDEYLLNPRGNPFRNDELNFNRWGASGIHTYALGSDAAIQTNVYGSMFFRDWWRQSSNSAQRPNDASDPLCGGMANLNTTCGNEGRLRKYYTWGFEPRMRMGHRLLGTRSEAAFGFRAHFETQDRQQQNGDRPLSRTGVLVENNERRNHAYSGFLQNQFQFGRFGVTPGIRLERVRYERTNRLANNGQGVTGETNLTQWIPGVGLTYTPVSALTLFTGIHRGFSPPRTEDIINNNTGGSIDLDAELSWNFEAGARARVRRLLTLEATWFRMDFENQIVPASVAGGAGAALTSAGETLHQGAEFSGRVDYRNILGSRHGGYLRAAYTWLPVSEFRGVRFSGVSGSGGVSVTGNRLPYSPRYLLNAIAGYAHSSGVNALIESVYQSSQFADDLNSIAVTPDGQRGAIPGATIFNATLNFPVEQWRTTLFITAKNLTDRLYIVDRSRGILPSMPRLIQAGFRFAF